MPWSSLRIPRAASRSLGCRGPHGRGEHAWLGLICGLWLLDVALRLHAETWWRGIGGAPLGPGGLALDLAAVCALVLVLRGVLASPAVRGWPWAAMLLLPALAMHTIGAWLAFGFHDVQLALAWSCVHAVVLTVAATFVVRLDRRLAALVGVELFRLAVQAEALFTVASW